jgi:hypothetical protein
MERDNDGSEIWIQVARLKEKMEDRRSLGAIGKDCVVPNGLQLKLFIEFKYQIYF